MKGNSITITLGLPTDHTIIENGEQLDIDVMTARHLVDLGLIYDQGETAGAKLYHLVGLHTFDAIEAAIDAFFAPQLACADAPGESLRAVALTKTPAGYKAMGPGPRGDNEIVFVHESEPYFFSLALVETIVFRKKVIHLNTYFNGFDGGRFCTGQPMEGRAMEKAVRLGIEDGLYEVALAKTRLSKPRACQPDSHFLAAR